MLDTLVNSSKDFKTSAKEFFFFAPPISPSSFFHSCYNKHFACRQLFTSILLFNLPKMPPCTFRVSAETPQAGSPRRSFGYFALPFPFGSLGKASRPFAARAREPSVPCIYKGAPSGYPPKPRKRGPLGGASQAKPARANPSGSQFLKVHQTKAPRLWPWGFGLVHLQGLEPGTH